jgi:phosphoribosylanthranilate isomerase
MLSTFCTKGHIPHVFMIGGLVSYKTLIDLKDEPILLLKNEVRAIFEELVKQSRGDVFFMLHYFTESLEEVAPELQEKARSIVTTTLFQQIRSLVGDLYELYESSQPPFQIGVQFNVSWPEPDEINQIKSHFPKLKTILQVSNFTFLEQIQRYHIDYVLIDASRGRGIPFHLDESIEVHHILSRNTPALLGFAGGLSPENVKDRIYAIRQKLQSRHFSIDAESGLRTGRYLDIRKVERYLKQAIKTFQEQY